MVFNKSKIAIILLFLLGVILFSILTWSFYTYSARAPGGSDFLIQWTSTRMYIFKGLSPYSLETALAVQNQVYGHPAGAVEDQTRFVNPFYAILFFTPYALLSDYALARALWMSTVEVLLLVIAFCGLRLAYWRPGKLTLVIYLVFALFWYPAIRSLINGNPAIISVALAILSLLCIRSGKDILAGLLLGLATIKPQIVVLLIPFVLFWACFQKRYRLVISTIFSLVVLVGISFLLQPGWMNQNLEQILIYPSYTPPATPAAIFEQWVPGIGEKLGWALTFVLSLVLAWEWWGARKKPFPWFLWTAFLTLLFTKMIGIRTSTEHYLDLLPALVLVFSIGEHKLTRFGKWIAPLSMLIFLFGLWILFLATLKYSPQPMQHSIMFFPLPIFLLFGLYWIRSRVVVGNP